MEKGFYCILLCGIPNFELGLMAGFVQVIGLWTVSFSLYAFMYLKKKKAL